MIMTGIEPGTAIELLPASAFKKDFEHLSTETVTHLENRGSIVARMLCRDPEYRVLYLKEKTFFDQTVCKILMHPTLESDLKYQDCLFDSLPNFRGWSTFQNF